MIIFIHIPSTSGTTLFENFSQTYGSKHVIRVFHTEPEHRVKGLFKKVGVRLPETHPFLTGEKPRVIKSLMRQIITRPRAIEKLGFIGGHIRLKDLSDIYMPEEHKLITFIRHPVERLMSEYRRKVRNDRTDFFVGDANIDIIELAKRQKSFLIDFLLTTDAENLNNQKIMKAAKDTAKKYFFIGVAEKRDESLKLLMHKLGYPLEGLDLRLNVGEEENERLSTERGVKVVNSKTVPNDIRPEVENIMSKDIQFYDYLVEEISASLDNVSGLMPSGTHPFK